MIYTLAVISDPGNAGPFCRRYVKVEGRCVVFQENGGAVAVAKAVEDFTGVIVVHDDLGSP